MEADWTAVLALVLVIEGILPFAAPRLWRRMVQELAGQEEGKIRLWGLSLMLAGVLFLYLYR